jgi:IS66 Orf2 like protein.
MKMFVEPADIYLYMDVVDFRKSINGLIVVVETGYEPESVSRCTVRLLQQKAR